MLNDFIDLLLLLNVVRLSYDKQYILIDHLNIKNIDELIDSLYTLPFDHTIIEKLRNRIEKTDIEKYKNSLYENNIKFTFITDDKYPENLKNIPCPPPVLYYKGELSEDYNRGISVVGSRKCTDYGKAVCEELVRDLSQYNIPIISGLALGIDGIAHRTAIEMKNKTIGVLGNSLDQIYPKRHKTLYYKMEEIGCILSEFPLGSDPKPYNFPQRNKIISGIGLGVLVIEAQEKSGTLLTVSAACEQGKDVFAVPGNIFAHASRGTNKLIQDGAKLVLNVEDILEEITIWNTVYSEKEKNNISEELKEKEEIIFNSLLESPKNSDDLCMEHSMKISEVLEIITALELRGIIGMIGDKYHLLKK